MASSALSIGNKVSAWLVLSRPAFHTVGVLPFLLGTLMARRLCGAFEPAVFALGLAAVVLILLATYHMGEYYDLTGDRISKSRFPNRFAGGSGVLPRGFVNPRLSRLTGIVAIAAAACLGLILQFALPTGPYTFVMGVIGGFLGFFYSTPPLRLVQRGVGEAAIAFCYGWLPVAAAFYIQTGTVHASVHWVAVPIAATIFNVILLNEFPDYEADRAVAKTNLLVRLGLTAGAFVYVLFALAAVLSFFLSLAAGVPFKGLLPFAPVAALSLWLVRQVGRGRWRDEAFLEKMCGLNILVNLGTTASYLYSYW